MMSHSPLIQKNRDEQREEAIKLTPGERIQMACELSDTCALLNQAARKALEEKRVNTKT
jgi:hypothetical protein